MELRRSLIGLPTFEHGINNSTFISEALEKLPKLNYIDAQLVMRDLYETRYGIYDHLQSNLNTPFAAVRLHKGEDTISYGLLEDVKKSYKNDGIFEIYHINFLEYLQLPRAICDLLGELAEPDRTSNNNAAEEMAKKLNAIEQKNK